MKITRLLLSLTMFPLGAAQGQNFGTQGNSNANTNNSVIVSGQSNNIGAGASRAFIGAGQGNNISTNARAAFIGGGESNSILPGSIAAVLVGGRANSIRDTFSVLVGGEANSAAGRYSAILGGRSNSVSGWYATVTGGAFNSVSGNNAFVLGGRSNQVTGDFAVVLAGVENTASGTNSMAAGFRAKATNHGAFVWADRQNTDFSSTGTNQFLIRSAGGVGINTNNPGTNALLVRGRTQITGDLEVTGNILGNVAISNAAFSSVSASNAFTIQTAGTTGFTVTPLANDGQQFARNIVAGHPSNQVTVGRIGATIAGGGGVNEGTALFNTVGANFATVGGGMGNLVTGLAGVVSGGQNNQASSWAAVAGGFYNTASGLGSAIGGGDENVASATNATVGGGYYNVASGPYSTVAGGINNLAGPTNNNTVAESSTVGGGDQNEATADFATVPGGKNNVASGIGSFAAGVNAQATNNYSFVWGGAPNTVTTSSADGDFTVRAPGGVALNTSVSDPALGAFLAPGDTAWSVVSDSNAKTAVTAIDHRETLRKLADLPVTTWRYKHDPNRRYIGPMAQDFHAAFGLGYDDKHISTLDTDGVTLSAIKGLVEELREQDAALDAREAKIRTLETQLQLLRQQAGL